MTRYFEELEHTADWAIRVWGNTLPALFEHAAEAMFELQAGDPTVAPSVTREVHCQALDLESLLIAWLSELLFHSETSDVLFNTFRVEIAEQPQSTGADAGELQLHAIARGYPGRGPLAHVKAVTYYGLSVGRTDEGWQATITFDT